MPANTNSLFLRGALFFPGDILLKIDTRGVMLGTRHHAMLVVGTDGPYPVVVHMTFVSENFGKLVQEVLTHGKDLFLVSFNFPERCREAILNLSKQCIDSKKFFINKKIIDQQYFDCQKFKSDMQDECRIKMDKLNALFLKFETNFTICPTEETLISCHEFVIALIHLACQTTNTPLPEMLAVPPIYGWSDILFHRYWLYPEKNVTLKKEIAFTPKGFFKSPVAEGCAIENRDISQHTDTPVAHIPQHEK